MQLRKPSRLSVLAGALLAATTLGVAFQTGSVIITAPGVNAAFNVDIPPGTGSYQVTVYDHDGWWNPDDVLHTVELKDVPGGEPPPKVLNLQVLLTCVDGNVCGTGSSHESEAEVYCVVTWYPASAAAVNAAAADDTVDDVEPSGSTETEIQSATCK